MMKVTTVSPKVVYRLDEVEVEQAIAHWLKTMGVDIADPVQNMLNVNLYGLRLSACYTVIRD